MTAARSSMQRSTRSASRASTARCLHCDQPLVSDRAAPFCCVGCRAVNRLLRIGGLTRYYDLRRGPGLPPVDLESRRVDHKWLELIEQERAERGPPGPIDLDVQGIHCAACVWLFEELFRRHGGAAAGTISINPARGRVALQVSDDFPLTTWVEAVEEFGYVLGPAKSEEKKRSDDLLIRVGICVALAANTMVFAIATYLGLDDGPLYELLNQLSYAAGLLSVLVGGSVFIRSAAVALRRRVLHLDVPIALGIVLAFTGSTWSFFFASGHAAYMDTLTVFVALMLVGRWLQQRMLERNRAQLLADDGARGLLTRRIGERTVSIVPCTTVKADETLLIAPGELVPLPLRLDDEHASCSLDWIDGESRPRRFRRGETVPAGSFNVGSHAFSGTSLADFDLSRVASLTGNASKHITEDEPVATRWWSRLARFYVLGVVGLAVFSIAFWWWWSANPLFAIEVGTAVLIVTCPCAFGIAAPLAYEIVLTELRRRGVFVRLGDFLDRVRSTTKIVFDKTGTLTTGSLELTNPTALAALSERETSVLYNMTARSAHPKSLAIRRALEELGDAGLIDLRTEERPGLGLEAQDRGHAYRLGSPGWASGGVVCEGDVVFAADGRVLAGFAVDERLRPGAGLEIDGLKAEGYELTILSGDDPVHVERLAGALQVPKDQARGALSPEEKAGYVRDHDPEHTLLIGDGLNDRMAMEVASCTGTPAVNRPFMASRCDFYFVSPGLGAVTQVLHAAERLGSVVRQTLGFALVYNVLAVSLAVCGVMKPWLAAVLMPASSLSTLAYTALALRGRGEKWKS